ncbi:hypothetical protein GJA_4876 [Janthinobacterium agaricidamnosum NBRC 102515 = DSM 9628]|uniref:Uncharacterized protein n=1 Tax=Janthinobacterium agaricidamnosum NBRC 102515 = DSM 9628 TaxID=1349767 RepID=W0VCV7_9BURK|nr:hypothetical protein GJA_4876 [Janthinobacterium agaricidamnosum NBRC 102515 = DSM 9628]
MAFINIETNMQIFDHKQHQKRIDMLNLEYILFLSGKSIANISHIRKILSFQ